MAKALLPVFFLMLWMTGFSQSLSFHFGTPFRRADLDVRWDVPTNELPFQVSVYRLLPNRFSPEIISNIMDLCSFTEKEKTRDDTNWLVFEDAGHSRRLGFLFSLGSIEYDTPEIYNPTNLIREVPTEKQLLRLAPDLLPRLGIRISDIDKKENSPEPDIHVFDNQIMFFVNHTTITNTVYRGIRFRRAVNGASFTGAGSGGDCEIRFGDHGKVSKISLTWRSLQRYKDYPAATSKAIISWIRQGKAVQNMLPMDAEPIDWRRVKSMTISKATLCCYAGDPFDPSEWLIPFVSLWTSIDTGHGNIEVEVDCPIIDRTQAAGDKAK